MRSAATAESTPPDSPQTTRPSSTCSRMRATSASRNCGHAPVAGAAGDLADEIGDQRRALRRVHHLGVELHAVEPARIVGDGRERRAGRDADRAEARRQLGHPVAVAHPHLRALAFFEHALEQRRLVDDLQLGAAELAGVPRFHLAAERRHHGLLAVADAEHRHARVEHGLRRLRRAGLVHGGRAAGQDDGAGAHRASAASALSKGTISE